MLNFGQIAHGVWLHIEYSFLAAVFASLVEIALPGEERQSLASRVRGFSFSLFYYLTATTLILSLRQALALTGYQPLVVLDLTGAISSSNFAIQLAGYVLAPFAAILLHDFLFYWFHRMQHAVPFLWRFHRVHHAIREMNAFNSYHHVTEEFLRIPFMMLPLLFLINVQATQVIFVVLLMRAHAALQHSNSRFSYWHFKYVFAEPIFHRIHHSTEQRHWGRNFSGVFTVWDMIFGTAYFAKHRELFTTGLADQDEARTLREYLFPPPLAKARPAAAVHAVPVERVQRIDSPCRRDAAA